MLNNDFSSLDKKLALYVFTRMDIKPINRCVQSGHAAVQYLIKYPNPIYKNELWTNGYLIYLQVDNEFSLNCLYDQFNVEGRNVAKFIEPDWGDPTCTAISTLGYMGEDFTNYKLLSINTPLDKIFNKIKYFLKKVLKKGI
jgi:hypothetical protein